LPGPLFSFAAYLGAVAAPPAGSIAAALLALTAVFLPGLLLAVAGLRAFHWIASTPRALGALAGIDAAVVGVLGAALYDPVWTSAVADPADALVGAAGFVLLQRWKVAPLAVVVFCVAVATLRQLAR
jgi:chromate transporter